MCAMRMRVQTKWMNSEHHVRKKSNETKAEAKWNEVRRSQELWQINHAVAAAFSLLKSIYFMWFFWWQMIWLSTNRKLAFLHLNNNEEQTMWWEYICAAAHNAQQMMMEQCVHREPYRMGNRAMAANISRSFSAERNDERHSKKMK